MFAKTHGVNCCIHSTFKFLNKIIFSTNIITIYEQTNPSNYSCRFS